MRRSLPPHGAPQYDTRENERPDMCSTCEEDPDICGHDPKACEQVAAENADEHACEARREEPDDDGVLSGRYWT